MADAARLQILLDLEDKVSGELSKVGTNFKDLGIKAGIAGAAITGVLAGTVYAAADAEKQMALADQALSNFVKTTGGGAKDLAALKASMGQVGDAAVKLGFDDEAASRSFASLVASTGDAKTAMSATKSAMDLAAAKGIDLETATKMVNMALQGSPKLLKEYGIALEDGASQGEILAAINEKVGGSAQAMSQTFSGQLAVMKVTVGNLAEQIGSVLLPILTQIAQAVTPVIQAIINWTQAHPGLTKVIVIAVGVLGLLLSAFSAIVLIGPTVGAAFTLMLGPVGLVILAIAALVAAGVYLWKHWDDLKANAKLIWSGIAKFVTDNWRAIVQILLPGIGSLVVFLYDNFGKIKAGWEALWNGAKNLFTSVWEGIKSGLRASLNWMIEKLNTLISGLNKLLAVGNKVGLDMPSIPKIPMLARGGTAQAGMPHIVGEAGPELFVPGRTGTVMPNGSFGGPSVTVNIYGDVSGQEVVEKVKDALMRQVGLNLRYTLT